MAQLVEDEAGLQDNIHGAREWGGGRRRFSKPNVDMAGLAAVVWSVAGVNEDWSRPAVKYALWDHPMVVG